MTHWQKSSYCAQGDACLSVAAASDRTTVQLTENSDTRFILSTNPATWGAFLRALKEADPQ
jgi:hypothetical protein